MAVEARIPVTVGLARGAPFAARFDGRPGFRRDQLRLSLWLGHGILASGFPADLDGDASPISL